MKWRPSGVRGNCLFANADNIQYEELSCLYPALGMSYTQYV
jgi:hypothetical protein